MNTQDERQAFITWAARNQYDVSEIDTVYGVLFKRQSTENAWMGWISSAKAKDENLEGCVVVPVETPDQFTSKLEDHLLELWIGDWGCDWDGFVSVNGIKPENIWSMVVEAARGGNE